MDSKPCLAVFLLIISVTSSAFSWKINQFSEECVGVPPPPPQPTTGHSSDNLTTSKWSPTPDNSSHDWYLAYGSNVSLYRFASEILQVPIGQVRDDALYYNACFRFLGTESTPTFIGGFGSRRVSVKMVQRPDGAMEWTFPGIAAVSTIPFADVADATYVLFNMCWEDGLGSWVVISPDPFQKPGTVRAIHEFAKSVGFNPNFFTHIEYVACKK